MKATEDVISVLCNLKTEQDCEAHFKIFEVLKNIDLCCFSVVPAKPC